MIKLKCEKKLRLVNEKRIQKNNRDMLILEFVDMEGFDKYGFFVNSNLPKLEIGKDYSLLLEMYTYRGQTRFSLVGVE